MDEHYNLKDAGEALQQYMVDSKKATNHHLASKPQDSWLPNVSVISIDRERTWRLVETDSDNQLEEVVFKTQGIVAKKDLPPVMDAPAKDNYAFLQQHIQITGIGGEAFKETTDSIMEAQLLFERQFADGAWEKWTPDNTDDYIALDISNRYFETMKTHPQEQAEFKPGVDPRGILAAACAKRNLVHTEDNKVRFYTSKVDEEGERRFVSAEPQIFRVRDIVEVQLSIVAVSMKKSQRKMKLKLRTVAMLDESFTKEHARAIHQNALTDKAEKKGKNIAAEDQRNLKRKVGY